MATETSEMEFDLLARFAREAGFFVKREKLFDPARTGGDLFLQESDRASRAVSAKDGKQNVFIMPSLLRYATAEQIYQYINAHRYGRSL